MKKTGGFKKKHKSGRRWKNRHKHAHMINLTGGKDFDGISDYENGPKMSADDNK